MSKDNKVVNLNDQKKAQVHEVVAGVRAAVHLTVDGSGEVIFAKLGTVEVGAFSNKAGHVLSAHDKEWLNNHAPLVVAWFAKLVQAGIVEATKEYAVEQAIEQSKRKD